MSKSRIDRSVFGKLADAFEVKYQTNKALEAAVMDDTNRSYVAGNVATLGWAKRLLRETTLDALALPQEVCKWAQDMAKQMGATHWKWTGRETHQWVRFYVLPPDSKNTSYTLYTLYESDCTVYDTQDDGNPVFQYRTTFSFSRGNGVKADLATGELMPIESSIWEFQQQLLSK